MTQNISATPTAAPIKVAGSVKNPVRSIADQTLSGALL
jgi:hypothetical protein